MTFAPFFSAQPNTRILSVAKDGDQLGSGVSVNSKGTEKTITVPAFVLATTSIQ